MKAFFLNFIISFQGFIALYDGNIRQRFIQSFCDFAPLKYHDHQMIDMLLIALATLMILISITSSQLLKLLAIFASISHTCFCYNVGKNHDIETISIVLSQMIVIFIALDSNIESYVNNQIKERQLNQKLSTGKQINVKTNVINNEVKKQTIDKKDGAKPQNKQNNKQKQSKK